MHQDNLSASNVKGDWIKRNVFFSPQRNGLLKNRTFSNVLYMGYWRKDTWLPPLPAMTFSGYNNQLVKIISCVLY